MRAGGWVRRGWRSSSSHAKVAKKLSVTALSMLAVAIPVRVCRQANTAPITARKPRVTISWTTGIPNHRSKDGRA